MSEDAAALVERVREALRFYSLNNPLDAYPAEALAALDSLTAALERAEAALRMLWDHYLLVISDEQKAQVLAALDEQEQA